MYAVSPPIPVMLGNFVNGTTNSIVTIQWTPPPNAGNVMYTIVVTPLPESGPVMATASTQTSTTLLYNTQYTVSVSIMASCAEVATSTFTLG